MSDPFSVSPQARQAQQAKQQAQKQQLATATAQEQEAGFSAGASHTSNIPGNSNWEHASNIYNQSDETYDADLYRAAILQRYLRGEGGLQNSVKSYAGDMNTDVARAAMNKYLAQAGQRKGLKGQLGGLGAMQGQEELHVKQDGERAIGEGVKNTRQNFNQRGLLYGGMREGGEAEVKAQGAATVANNLSGVKRDYANKTDAIKQSIAAIGLQNAQEAQQRQQVVMETSMRNSVARQQAYQQLGEGVGYAAGSYYGNQRPGSDDPSAAGFNQSVGNNRYIRPEVA